MVSLITTAIPTSPIMAVPETSAKSSANLNVTDIETYDHNARLVRNPKWAEIEASIVASGGLTQALAVTKRPGSTKFTVHQGGNTRLRILKRLFDQTGDPRFGKVQVEVHPFTSELELAALHERENLCRGDLTFFEQAWGKFRQFELYCQESKGRPTARAFLKHLHKEYGDTTSVETFSRMKYAVEVLYQHIPTCLVQGGMPQKAIRRFIKIRTALEKGWTEHRIGSKGDFEDVFFELLSRQDKDLADTFLSVDSAHITDKRIAIDWGQFEVDFCHECSITADNLDFLDARAWVAPVIQNAVVAVTPFDDAFLNAPIPSEMTPASLPKKMSNPMSVAALRARAHKLAQKIAAAGELSDLVVATPDSGYGYTITTTPSRRSLSPTGIACWWALTLGLGDSGREAHMNQDVQSVPSIAALSGDLLEKWATLLKLHARLSALLDRAGC